MKQYIVTGMSCAACQAKVEKAVNAVEGVDSCAVSLLTNSMGVEGSASAQSIIKAVEKAGYKAMLKGNKDGMGNNQPDNEALEDHETPLLVRRLIISLALMIPLVYVSMGHMMWKWPVPAFLAGNCLAIGIYEMLLSGLVMVVNQKFFISGFKGLVHSSPNMDTLVALGSMASFGYSVYALFAMSSFAAKGDMDAAAAYMHELYFESAAMILTLITVGKMLEARAKGKTTNALKALVKLSPKTAVVIRNEAEITVPVEEVAADDLFIIKPGMQIPVDGIIEEGFSAVDEAAFTGESIPVDKKAGDKVLAGTINLDGYLTCRATEVGEDTALSRIIQLVSDTATTKAPIAKIADKVSGVFVPVVISIAVLTFLCWLLLGAAFGQALSRAICVLVISCPCALGLATPVAIMVGNGVGARNGILFKTAEILEMAGKVQIMALDKTGTVTTGQMSVTDVVNTDGVSKDELLMLAAALESKSEHPISKAITDMAKEKGLTLPVAEEFSILAGNGLKGIVNGRLIFGGNAEYIKSVSTADMSLMSEKAKQLSVVGKTPVYFAAEDKLLGLIAVADTIKADSKEAIALLKSMGIRVVMLTGDNEITARAIAAKVDVDEVIASVKPDGKSLIVKRLMELGKVAMVGDGINDAPALTQADVGIAIGAGTDIAIDAADIVLSKNSLKDAAAAIRISKATIKNIYENLFWAFIYNIIGIPLAAGCFVLLFGWSLSPMFGAAAMSLSSFCVVTNALRINMVKIYSSKGGARLKYRLDDKKLFEGIIKEFKEETKIMQICVKGMMCGHCEAHVKKALENIDGIENAAADHENNLVTLTTTKQIEETEIKAAIDEAGYEYEGIVS